MELTLPDTWAVSIEILVAFTLFVIVVVWAAAGAYRKIMSEIHAMRQDISAMKQRNTHADAETEKVKTEQAKQETTVAVMAERVGHLVDNGKAMQSTLDEILKELRKQS